MNQDLRGFEEKHGQSRIGQLEKVIESAVAKRAPLIVDVPSEKNTIQFGLYGDTQFGNVNEAVDEYYAYLARLRAEGITVKIHAGDVFDGHKVYRGQEFDLHALGWEAQKRHFLKVEPAAQPGEKTYFITGNHDASLMNLAGVDVGKSIAEIRSDWVYVGAMVGDIILRTENGRKYHVRLIHPDGGTAYAISYKMQGYVNSLEGGTKPHMVAMGHFHKAEHLPSYRNIDGIQVGCFEWQTSFMARKGSQAHVGGWIVRVTVGDKRSMSNSVRAEFMAFYKKG
jgi:UDP-2,3-diacylglucosamine pyrophosphatase LpxH